MRLIGSAILMTIISIIAGCAGKKQEKTAPPLPQTEIGGTVTLDSKPLEGAKVTFAPVGDPSLVGGYGVTNAAGEYKLSSLQGKSLAPANYKVTISLWRMPDGTPVPPGAPVATSGGKESLSRYYSDENLTTLKAKVSSPSDKFNFELIGGQ